MKSTKTKIVDKALSDSIHQVIQGLVILPSVDSIQTTFRARASFLLLVAMASNLVASCYWLESHIYQFPCEWSKSAPAQLEKFAFAASTDVTSKMHALMPLPLKSAQLGSLLPCPNQTPRRHQRPGICIALGS